MNPIVKNIALKLCETAPACLLEVLLETLLKVWNDYIREFKLPYRSIDVAELKGVPTASKSSKTIFSEVSRSEFEPASIEICDKEFPIPQEDEQLFFNYFCKHMKDKNIQPSSVTDNQEIPEEPGCSTPKDTETVGNRVDDKYINLERKVQNSKKENEGTKICTIKSDVKKSKAENEITPKKKEFVIEISLQPDIKVSYKLAESFGYGGKSKDVTNHNTQNIENNGRNLQENLANKENICGHETLSTLQNSTISHTSKEAKLSKSRTLNIQKICTSLISSDTVIAHNGMSTDGNKHIVSYEKHKTQSQYVSLLQKKSNMERSKTQYTSKNQSKLGIESLPWHDVSSTISHFVDGHPCYDSISNFLEKNKDPTFAMYSDSSYTLENNKVMKKEECKMDKRLQRETSPISTCSAKGSFQETSNEKEESKDTNKNNQESNGFCAKAEIHDRDYSQAVKEGAKIENTFTPQLCNNEVGAVKYVHEITEQNNEQNEVNMKLNITDEKNSTAETQTEKDRIKSKSSENRNNLLWNIDYLELIGKDANSSFKHIHGESADLKQIKDDNEPYVKSKRYTKEHNMNECNRQLVRQFSERKNDHNKDYSDKNKISIIQYDKHRNFENNNPSKNNSLSNIILNSQVSSNIIVSSKQGSGLSIGEPDCKSGDQPATSKETTEENIEKYIQYKKCVKAKQQYLEICHQNATTVVFGSCPLCIEKHLMPTSAKTLKKSNRCNRKIDMYPKKRCKSEIYLSKSSCRVIRQSTRNNLCMKSSKNTRRVSFSEDNSIFSFNPEESIFETFYGSKAKVERNMGEKKEEYKYPLMVIQDAASTPITVNSSSNKIQVTESIEYSLKEDDEKEKIDIDKYSSTVDRNTEIIGVTKSNSSNQVQGGESSEYVNLGFVDVPLFDCFPEFQQDSCDSSKDLQHTDDDCLLSKANFFHDGEHDKFPQKLKNAEANIKRWAVKNLMPRRRLSFQKIKSAIQKK